MAILRIVVSRTTRQGQDVAQRLRQLHRISWAVVRDDVLEVKKRTRSEGPTSRLKLVRRRSS